MKILISAYACEPDKGSEPAVGWNWVQALVRRGYRVHVITRSNNREPIERFDASRNPLLTFHYFDLSRRARSWKHAPGGIYLYYLFWQMGASRLALRLHEAERFERVHHVTFASFRQPSFMGRLGIPFVFGPVGGGESMPAQLRAGLPLRSRVAETVRGLGNRMIALDPFMRSTFARAEVIACTTRETLARIPRRYQNKCVVQLAIGINQGEIAPGPAIDVYNPDRFLFIGRLLYWKGLHLLFEALVEVKRSMPSVRLRVIGTGGEREWLMTRAQAAGVADCVEWIASTPHGEIAREYRENIALVFPSLHDSGGMVVLEALAAGLPVICLDLGGPGAIADSTCARVIETHARSAGEIAHEIAVSMLSVAGDRALRASLSAQGPRRAQQLTWDRAAETIYVPIEAAESAR